MSHCIFCKIICEEAAGDVLYRDQEIIVFKDIKPASKHHYLAVPIKHIENIKALSVSEHSELLTNMIEKGKSILQENGGDTNDILLGFHRPPFNSIRHLHLHIISPASEMSFLSRLIFKPNTWWFEHVDKTLENLHLTNKL